MEWLSIERMCFALAGSECSHHRIGTKNRYVSLALDFSLILRSNLFLLMIKRSCLPRAMRSTSSWASISNTNRRPSTSISLTLAVTDSPGGVAAIWLIPVGFHWLLVCCYRLSALPADFLFNSAFAASSRFSMAPIANSRCSASFRNTL